MLAEREQINTETELVDGTEGVREDLRITIDTVAAEVVGRIFGEVARDGPTGYWWQVAVAVKVEVTIPAAVAAAVEVIMAVVAVVPVYLLAVGIVHEGGITDPRAREAKAVMQVMVAAPRTTTIVVMVE